MQAIYDIVATANSYLWGPWMLAALALTGTFLTVGLRFVPWRKLPAAFKLAVQPSTGEGDISPFQALMTALAATVGTGNIAGVATAIYFGGPGALFYMWVIALVGMATKYSEAVCAVAYREVDELGNHVGGPMYYIKNGVGAKFPRLAFVLAPAFAVFTALAGFGIGNGVQANSVAHVLRENFAVPNEVTGIVLMVVVGLVLIGGIKRIADVASALVPSMIVLYMGAGLVVLAINFAAIPDALALIFRSAFTPAAAEGGFAGATVMLAIRWGFARGIFSNEAGLGSAAIAHAAAKTNADKRGLCRIAAFWRHHCRRQPRGLRLHDAARLELLRRAGGRVPVRREGNRALPGGLGSCGARRCAHQPRFHLAAGGCAERDDGHSKPDRTRDSVARDLHDDEELLGEVGEARRSAQTLSPPSPCGRVEIRDGEALREFRGGGAAEDG